jgi:hypothetical protein
VLTIGIWEHFQIPPTTNNKRKHKYKRKQKDKNATAVESVGDDEAHPVQREAAENGRLTPVE